VAVTRTRRRRLRKFRTKISKRLPWLAAGLGALAARDLRGQSSAEARFLFYQESGGRTQVLDPVILWRQDMGASKDMLALALTPDRGVGPEGLDLRKLDRDEDEEEGIAAAGDLPLGHHDQLPRVIARTGYFGSYHLVGQWFPKIGVLELPGERGATAPRWNCHELHLNSEFYADFGSYDVSITAPKEFLASNPHPPHMRVTAADG